MKIIAVASNYSDHIAEMSTGTILCQTKPESPIFFLKGDAVHRLGYPFFYPDLSSQIEYETEIVVRIDRIGKYIDERFAHRYYSELTVGLDLTARDLQRQAKAAGKPWTAAKAFESSAVVGQFFPKEQFGDLTNLDFRLEIDGHCVQKGNTHDMLFSIDQLIAAASRIFPLRMGDLLYCGTPAGVGPIAIGQTLVGYVGNNKAFEMSVK
ncbi:2-hydroxyhepta-2,4-diene-1,7-dioate isomerase [Porphyromonas crevioricanis]|uniref:2-hydroxyhepta-2,4-diene-1,7-dioate isomerase n=2 Tax=Porphyromonas crevioricanis TaxID=393921 RepID=A0A0A2FH20_9PORP|nr:fumarylacetoacetate hydrolase family protein [Porphyromonas crevioricanis]KGN89382.1 2-hydroxyhepta-2,4-diene-1,7-dioate isomerase [Porphyromonas crevioricanis]KGN93564.1 2-hydroxyhepta-2,4-diene-1,7-dioate isomerase [Porphyromonas crevioricanis]SJZ87018.1 2-keto-4-pentenoate hydratase/2-oxohepta-3-ene-1,7-dioic acid hydratase (catechol pathway) [Porphyromonas crevioricanis]SQH73176.1 2-keto-4-pentenoate hydratase/2-oxohepta-3-ene-1,7-dioic acid hydratase (catechol pathway) [Porphyromonas cr